MAKKKKEEKSKFIPKDLYWEYRTTLEELKGAKLNQKRVHLEKELMNKEIENKKLKLALFKETVGAAHRSVSLREQDLEQIKQRIEEELGTTLDNCAIDPYTYEVRPIDDKKI